jgi:hypothetical protein
MSRDTKIILIVGGVALLAVYLLQKMNTPTTTVVATPKPATTSSGNLTTAYGNTAASLLNAGANLANAL